MAMARNGGQPSYYRQLFSLLTDSYTYRNRLKSRRMQRAISNQQFVSFRAEESLFCVEKDDYRWQPMCSNPLSNSVRDRLLGDEECKSPFGTYELQIPVDKTLSCKSTAITDTNCKDLDVSIAH